MDPVSIVDMLAAIQRLFDKTIAVLGYIKDAKHSRTDRSKFSRHLTTLLTPLDDLQDRVEEAESATDE